MNEVSARADLQSARAKEGVAKPLVLAALPKPPLREAGGALN